MLVLLIVIDVLTLRGTAEAREKATLVMHWAAMAAAIQLCHDYVEAISNGRLAGGDAFPQWLRSGRSGAAAAPAATGCCDRGRGSTVLRSRTVVRCAWPSLLLGRRPLAHVSSRARVGARNLSAQVARGARVRW